MGGHIHPGQVTRQYDEKGNEKPYQQVTIKGKYERLSNYHLISFAYNIKGRSMTVKATLQLTQHLQNLREIVTSQNA